MLPDAQLEWKILFLLKNFVCFRAFPPHFSSDNVREEAMKRGSRPDFLGSSSRPTGSRAWDCCSCGNLHAFAVKRNQGSMETVTVTREKPRDMGSMPRLCNLKQGARQHPNTQEGQRDGCRRGTKPQPARTCQRIQLVQLCYPRHLSYTRAGLTQFLLVHAPLFPSKPTLIF